MPTLAPPSAPPTDALRAQVRRVHEARGGLAVLQQALVEARQVFEAQHAELLRLARAASETVTAEEATLRALALDHYARTREKTPAPGVAIRIVKRVTLDYAAAFEAAKASGLALALDEKAAEKIALATPVSWAAVGEEPKALIASDLGAALEAVGR